MASKAFAASTDCAVGGLIIADLLGRRIAAVREIYLSFGDGIDLVGIDRRHAFAAEVARKRILACVDDATAGRAEHRVRLDVGARDDAVLEACGLAAAYGK